MTKPLSKDQLLQIFVDMDIAVSTVEHPPLYTVEESQSLRGKIAGGHTKNLFLKDKKDNFFLVTLAEDAVVDLKNLHKLVGGANRLSFGKPDKLMEYLGVSPGSVTALAVINDNNNMVKLVVDAPLLDHEVINCHPLVNTATTSIGRDDLLRFLSAADHQPLILKVSN